MAHFKVSAPGKVILYGEHAVVYGKTAIAASLNLRTTLDFKELPETEQLIKINFPKVQLLIDISIQNIQEFFINIMTPQFKDDHDVLYNYVQQFVERNATSINHQQKLSLEALLYLLVLICHKEQASIKPFQIHLDTSISISSGLGSSASFAVCLAACFLYWAHLQKDTHMSFDLSQLESKEIISEYALRCEKIMHGTPSGIDNSVCTFGSIIEFKKDSYVKPIHGASSMKILLVDTKVERRTKILVQKLVNLMKKYPAIINPIFDSIDNISKDALNIIKRIQSLSDTNNVALLEEYKQLMILTNINQSLLAACGASHPALDQICAEARNHALGAKLTGAGGGGYAYILLGPDTKSETISSITKKLTQDGYSVTLTSLGCNGVVICK